MKNGQYTPIGLDPVVDFGLVAFRNESCEAKIHYGVDSCSSFAIMMLTLFAPNELTFCYAKLLRTGQALPVFTGRFILSDY
jgi:hypothetical protein